MTSKPMLHLLSLGVGVQSSTLLMMYELGVIGPRPDYALFANTLWEPRKVYQYLQWLREHTSIPIIEVTRGDLVESALTVRRTRDGQRTYIKTGVPVHMVDRVTGERAGVGMRACTRDFKIALINAKARQLLGGGPQRGNEVRVMMAIGISLDEVDRMKPNPKKWIKSHWPLVDAGMSRADCLAWMEEHGYPLPPKSACIHCGWRDDDQWLALEPDEFAEAVRIDYALRDAYAQTNTIKGVPYLHESRIPLDQVKFKSGHRRKMAAQQRNLFRNDCVGMCGV